MRTAYLVLTLCCVSVGLASVPAVAGAPPPSQLCGVCGPGIATNAQIDGATGHGTLDIYINETGDSRWHARVPVTAAAADRYRTNATALEVAVNDAWARYHVTDGDVQAVETTLEGDTVVVNYTVEGVARRGVDDTWIVEYFATGTSPTRYQLVADRMTVHTPDGTEITNNIPAATVDGNTATWTNENGDELDSDFDDQTYITYGSDGLLDTARGYATIGLEIGPTALAHGVRGGLIPAVSIAFVGVVIGRTERGYARFDAATLEQLIVTVGVIGACILLVTSAVSTGAGLAPGAVALASLGAGYALLGIAARRLGSRLGTRGLAGLAVLAAITTAGVSVLLVGPPVYASPFFLGLATALCLPIGHAFARGRTPITLITVAALAPIAAIAATSPHPVSGYGVALFSLLFLPWAVSVATFGYPLALLGRHLALDD
ncbi:hypothetical protein BDK88_2794 [Natrinema hispanicum]|uniref:Uncharacterized protein n=1 Tax=Natrinema hispanicum TaxID=392421 RepID=A0A482Y5G8_9EURY|nr:hypothetical protein [Natrinema hispanicum]RZV08720.1 hypothetical protein BDK88_2794 [Natrinema hispanicum]